MTKKWSESDGIMIYFMTFSGFYSHNTLGPLQKIHTQEDKWIKSGLWRRDKQQARTPTDYSSPKFTETKDQRQRESPLQRAIYTHGMVWNFPQAQGSLKMAINDRTTANTLGGERVNSLEKKLYKIYIYTHNTMCIYTYTIYTMCIYTQYNI